MKITNDSFLNNLLVANTLTIPVRSSPVLTGFPGQIYASYTGSILNLYFYNGVIDVPLSGAVPSLILAGAVSGEILLSAPSDVSTYDLVFPANVGVDGYILQSDVSGATATLNWVPPNRLDGATSGNIQLAAPAVVPTNYTLVYPDSVGTNGYILKSTVSGATSTLDWVPPNRLDGVGGNIQLTAPPILSTTSYTIVFPGSNTSTDGYILKSAVSPGISTLSWVPPNRLDGSGGNVQLAASTSPTTSYSIVFPANVGTDRYILRSAVSGTVATMSWIPPNRLDGTTVGSGNIQLAAPATVPTSYTIVYPNSVGTTGSFLQSAVSGTTATLSWTTSVGGSNIGMAYITTGGNDGTGTGSISSPYATLQTAYNAGFRSFYIGAEVLIGNTMLSISKNSMGEETLNFYGAGPTVSNVQFINVTYQSGSQQLNIFSDMSVNLGNINLYGSSYVPSMNLVCHNCKAANITSQGGANANSGTMTLYAVKLTGSVQSNGGPGDAGVYGGSTGTMSITDCDIGGSVSVNGGAGGAGNNGSNEGDPGSSGGSGGSTGTVTIVNSNIASNVDVYAGSGGNGGYGVYQSFGDGGYGGDGGSGGYVNSVNIKSSQISGTVNLNAGSGSYGGDGGYSDYYNGGYGGSGGSGGYVDPASIILCDIAGDVNVNSGSGSYGGTGGYTNDYNFSGYYGGSGGSSGSGSYINTLNINLCKISGGVYLTAGSGSSGGYGGTANNAGYGGNGGNGGNGDSIYGAVISECQITNSVTHLNGSGGSAGDGGSGAWGSGSTGSSGSAGSGYYTPMEVTNTNITSGGISWNSGSGGYPSFPEGYGGYLNVKQSYVYGNFDTYSNSGNSYYGYIYLYNITSPTDRGSITNVQYLATFGCVLNNVWYEL